MQRSWNRSAAKIGEERVTTRDEPQIVDKTKFYDGFAESLQGYISCGEMAEWFNAAVLKTVEGAIPPRVRISVSPP